jgi:ATP-dependent helicase HrpA
VENPDRDLQRMGQIRPHGERLARLLAGLTSASSDEKRRGIEAYFWMLEEFKVSVFAQELKTPIPISAKRLDKKAAELERMA